VMTFDNDQEILNYLRVATREVLPEAYTNM